MTGCWVFLRLSLYLEMIPWFSVHVLMFYWYPSHSYIQSCPHIWAVLTCWAILITWNETILINHGAQFLKYVFKFNFYWGFCICFDEGYSSIILPHLTCFLFLLHLSCILSKGNTSFAKWCLKLSFPLQCAEQFEDHHCYTAFKCLVVLSCAAIGLNLWYTVRLKKK